MTKIKFSMKENSRNFAAPIFNSTLPSFNQKKLAQPKMPLQHDRELKENDQLKTVDGWATVDRPILEALPQSISSPKPRMTSGRFRGDQTVTMTERQQSSIEDYITRMQATNCKNLKRQEESLN